MFDPSTAALLRAAPAVPGLDPAVLPQTLTRRYAELVARRLRSGADQEGSDSVPDGEWPLTRIADTYELVTSIHEDREVRRSAAFVAGTAQQILAQEQARTGEDLTIPALDRDWVDAALAAAVLFLAAEQYADARDAARQIRTERQGRNYLIALLTEDIRDLARGDLKSILERAGRRPAQFVLRGGLEERAITALFESLLFGVELLASEVLGESAPASAAKRFDRARSAFLRVLDLSSQQHGSADLLAQPLLTTYPGPRHLASLLLAAYDATAVAAVTRIAPPPGVDNDFWHRWLRHRATSAPFVWPNHRDAIEKGFYHPGKSAVMVLPTGAGKTTVSCLKIASALAADKNVIFIAPTHALVDQLTADLQDVFPEEILDSQVSSDFDRLFATGTTLGKIEVMTPEHCLALLSYAPEVFANVGLMVFDECHLLSPVSGLRRALDGMFCVLAFNSVAPDADFLFLSAMIRNGAEFALWIAALTGRECVFVDPLWKPSRQARGVLIYKEAALRTACIAASRVQKQENAQKGKTATGLRTAAKAELVVEPYALFGLTHNWARGAPTDVAITKLRDGTVPLSGRLRGRYLDLMPNVNKVAANIAATSAEHGLKAIVFVNAKAHAVSTAKEIATALGDAPEMTSEEAVLWEALDAELGGRQHSLIPGPAAAVPHNAQMLRFERELAERMFRRADGARVIVATPTLAQGLNLPAELAILAGDMRANLDEGGREALEAHEILNAAARAGRAGHLANGVVLLIPEAVLGFSKSEPLNEAITGKLGSLLPEDDRCLDMSDPLQLVLDRISQAAVHDPDIEYALNRFTTAVAPEGADSVVTTRFSLDRSYAAFMAAQRKTMERFDAQVANLKAILNQRNTETDDTFLQELSAQSGAPMSALAALRNRMTANAGALPTTIADWVLWVLTWLAEDELSREALLGREAQAILGAVGQKKSSALTSNAIRDLHPGVLSWLTGEPLSNIERALGGDPDEDIDCPRARELVTRIVPLGLSFVFGLVAVTAKKVTESIEEDVSPSSVLDCLPTAVRRGFDSPLKLAFADVRKGLLSRVQYHSAFAAEVDIGAYSANGGDYASLIALMREHLGS